MEPLDPFLIALLHRRVYHFPFVRHREVVRRIAITLSEAVNQEGRILIPVVDDEGHGDYASFNLKFLLDLIRVIPEGDQHLLQLIHRLRHLKPKEVQPLFIDIGDSAYGLNRFLSLAQLLDPGEGINMAVRSGTHRTVFRIFFKYRLQVRHVFVDQVFQRNDDALLRITEQIVIVHPCRKQAVRKISELGQSQIFLIRELIVHEAGPVDMHVGLLLQPLKNQLFIRFLRCRCRCAGNKGKLPCFRQRKRHLAGRRIRIDIRSHRVLSPASRKGKQADRRKYQCCQTHSFSFHILLPSARSGAHTNSFPFFSDSFIP